MACEKCLGGGCPQCLTYEASISKLEETIWHMKQKIAEAQATLRGAYILADKGLGLLK